MSPKFDEVIEINSLSLVEPRDKDFFKIRERNKEKRLNLYHLVIHILSFVIIIPFVFMNLLGINISEIYSTIVSVVVGFYFARNIFN